jgi:thiol-disulfide isomerase/thioredoxin
LFHAYLLSVLLGILGGAEYLEDNTAMGNGLKVLCLLLVLASLVLAYCGRSDRVSGVAEIGAPAPTFELDDLQGRRVSLAEYRGKVVLLDFWATWCAPCRRSMPVLEKLQKEFPKDVVLLAINLQEPAEEVRDYVARRKVGSTVLLDADGEVGFAYGAEAIPLHVLIDKQGVIQDILVGLSPTMEEDLRAEIQKLTAAD